MAKGQARDRRGRHARGRSGLLDRGSSLEAITDVLDTIGASGGQALLLVGHPGMGKTRLYEAALDEARARKLMILRAAGSELEQNLAFGVVLQLLRSLLGGLTERRRQALLSDAPGRIRALYLGDEDANGGDAQDDLAIAHGLFSLVAAATETRPGLLALDDLHWSDAPSLSFLLYLLHRLEELPLAVVMTRRPGTSEDHRDLLDQVTANPLVDVQNLEPLGLDAVREMVGQALAEQATEALVETCMEATTGNPFYLHELLLALAEDGEASTEQLQARVRLLAPDTVARSLRVRVGRLGAGAAALARAVAILGDDVALRLAASLAGLTIAQAGQAADALASVEVLLAREPLRFVHPLVRQVVQRDVAASELATRHLEAARLRQADGENSERVAAHLLLGRAEGDPWAVEQLRAAARDALGRGGAQSAVRYLERALAEPPAAEIQGLVLAELGNAEAVLGLPSAADRFAAALSMTDDCLQRARLSLMQGRALHSGGHHEAAAAAFDAGLRGLPQLDASPEEAELHDELQSGFLATSWLVPWLQAQAIKRSVEQRRRALTGPRSHGQRLLLAQAAVHAAFDGEPGAEVTRLAEAAWEGGQLLERESADGVGSYLVNTALCLAGALESAVQVADATLADAQRRGSPLGFATASFLRGIPLLWRGEVVSAAADLEQARDAQRFGWRRFARLAAAHYCLCLVERGELDQAEAVLTADMPLREPYDLEDAVRLYALAELRLAQGRLEESFALAETAGGAAENTVRFLGFCPWRTCAARAALGLRQRDRALELAREAHERAHQTGVLHQRIRTEYVLGVCEGGEAELDRLRAAVALGEQSPPRIETVRALVALGSALRRSNERLAAREPLQRAADLARERGAVALFERARLELSASGARPRREALLSGPDSLTASERRIAELAASGQSNREIAGALFVTPKTVEYHLRNAYRKLGIQTRRDLVGALET